MPKIESLRVGLEVGLVGTKMGLGLKNVQKAENLVSKSVTKVTKIVSFGNVKGMLRLGTNC